MKYHMGATRDVEYGPGLNLTINLISNPSHLEAVDPVVYGKTRAKQELKDGGSVEKSVAVLFHGDAALCG